LPAGIAALAARAAARGSTSAAARTLSAVYGLTASVASAAGSVAEYIAIGNPWVGGFVLAVIPTSTSANDTTQGCGGPCDAPGAGNQLQSGTSAVYSKPPSDAKDPEGAKAPGKPGDAEGFRDSRSGEKWGKAPNGKSGWVDEKGNVWVPTGQGGAAHGGPHWDVQKPGGGYDNVYPGGNVRPGQ